MKTYVLTVSERFPKTHPRAGEKTEFPLAIVHYDKIHTIRANYALWEKRFKKINKGEACLSVRIWSGKPYRSKQQEIFRYDHTRGIGIEKLFLEKDLHKGYVNRFLVHGGVLAKNDGLSFPDFQAWFSGYGMTEPLAIIHFTDFRYGN